jgi:hypothetical protein
MLRVAFVTVVLRVKQSVVMLWVIMLSVIMLSVIVLSVIMLSDIILIFIMLSAVALLKRTLQKRNAESHCLSGRVNRLESNPQTKDLEYNFLPPSQPHPINILIAK